MAQVVVVATADSAIVGLPGSEKEPGQSVWAGP